MAKVILVIEWYQNGFSHDNICSIPLNELKMNGFSHGNIHSKSFFLKRKTELHPKK